MAMSIGNCMIVIVEFAQWISSTAGQCLSLNRCSVRRTIVDGLHFSATLPQICPNGDDGQLGQQEYGTGNYDACSMQSNTKNERKRNLVVSFLRFVNRYGAALTTVLLLSPRELRPRRDRSVCKWMLGNLPKPLTQNPAGSVARKTVSLDVELFGLAAVCFSKPNLSVIWIDCTKSISSWFGVLIVSRFWRRVSVKSIGNL